MKDSYNVAREIYKSWGIDTEEVLKQMDNIPISINCWQIDDLTGFEDFDAALTGGIAATGNAPGKPSSIEEYFTNMDKVLSLVPGAKKLALHSVYTITGDRKVERNKITPADFKAWVEYAQKQNIGLDFNPTYFSHEMLKDGWTLSSKDKSVRDYWVEHGIACRKIGEYFGKELNSPCITNHWIPDGSKDIRIDTEGPRQRLVESLDRIFEEPIDKRFNRDSIEGKLFGFGVESYTVGSHEFYSNYALKTGKAMVCMDIGHYHPTENVADKLSAFLVFDQEIMMHFSRAVRWDSDHVPVLGDEIINITKEIKRCNAFEKVHIGLDCFDASINRVAASVIAARSVKKALMLALLEPTGILKEAEEDENLTKRIALQEEVKLLPAGIVFDEYCERHHVKARDWMEELK